MQKHLHFPVEYRERLLVISVESWLFTRQSVCRFPYRLIYLGKGRMKQMGRCITWKFWACGDAPNSWFWTDFQSVPAGAVTEQVPVIGVLVWMFNPEIQWNPNRWGAFPSTYRVLFSTHSRRKSFLHLWVPTTFSLVQRLVQCRRRRRLRHTFPWVSRLQDWKLP